MKSYLCSIIVVTSRVGNLYVNVTTIMEHWHYYIINFVYLIYSIWFICPIIIGTFSLWYFYEDITTIMEQW